MNLDRLVLESQEIQRHVEHAVPIVGQGSRLEVRRKGEAESPRLGSDLLQVVVDFLLELGDARKPAAQEASRCARIPDIDGERAQ